MFPLVSSLGRNPETVAQASHIHPRYQHRFNQLQSTLDHVLDVPRHRFSRHRLLQAWCYLCPRTPMTHVPGPYTLGGTGFALRNPGGFAVTDPETVVDCLHKPVSYTHLRAHETVL